MKGYNRYYETRSGWRFGSNRNECDTRKRYDGILIIDEASVAW